MSSGARPTALALLLLGSLALACGTGGGPPLQPKPLPSGYLGDYSDFVADPTRGGALFYQHPDADLADYDKLIIPPVRVVLQRERGVPQEDLDLLAGYLHSALLIAMRGAYPVVEEPGPGVLRVRVAITDLVPAQSAGVVGGKRLFIGQVQIEGEALDSVSSQRLMGLVDRKVVGRRLAEGSTQFGTATQAFREWAVGFRLVIDRAHRRAREGRAKLRP